jgi:hypothetical protein
MGRGGGALECTISSCGRGRVRESFSEMPLSLWLVVTRKRLPTPCLCGPAPLQPMGLIDNAVDRLAPKGGQRYLRKGRPKVSRRLRVRRPSVEHSAGPGAPRTTGASRHTYNGVLMPAHNEVTRRAHDRNPRTRCSTTVIVSGYFAFFRIFFLFRSVGDHFELACDERLLGIARRWCSFCPLTLIRRRNDHVHVACHGPIDGCPARPTAAPGWLPAFAGIGGSVDVDCPGAARAGDSGAGKPGCRVGEVARVAAIRLNARASATP